MDIGKIISRAWKITWRWKALWLLGLLAALGSGSNNSPNVRFDYDLFRPDAPIWARDWEQWVASPRVIPLLLGLMGLAALFGLALWVVSIIAKGGLIAGVQQVEEEGSTSFRRGWRLGVARFWTLLGINLLFTLAIIVLVGLLIAFVVIVIMAGGGSIRNAGIRDALPAVVLPLVLCGAPLCCGVILLGIALGVLHTFAQRAAVLENHNVFDAIGRGWQVIRRHPGNTLLLMLVFVGIGIGIGWVMGLLGGAIAGPLAFSFLDHTPTAVEISSLVVISIVMGLIGLFVNTILTTFTSVVWTLAYREFTLPQPAPVDVTPVADETADVAPQ